MIEVFEQTSWVIASCVIHEVGRRARDSLVGAVEKMGVERKGGTARVRTRPGGEQSRQSGIEAAPRNRRRSGSRRAPVHGRQEKSEVCVCNRANPVRIAPETHLDNLCRLARLRRVDVLGDEDALLGLDDDDARALRDISGSMSRAPCPLSRRAGACARGRERGALTPFFP